MHICFVIKTSQPGCKWRTACCSYEMSQTNGIWRSLTNTNEIKPKCIHSTLKLNFPFVHEYFMRQEKLTILAGEGKHKFFNCKTTMCWSHLELFCSSVAFSCAPLFQYTEGAYTSGVPVYVHPFVVQYIIYQHTVQHSTLAEHRKEGELEPRFGSSFEQERRLICWKIS